MKTVNTDFSTASVHDKVYSIIYGWGEVEEVSREVQNYITVNFTKKAIRITDRFHFNGYNYNNLEIIRTLYWQPPEMSVVDQGKPIQLSKLPVDTLIWVYSSISNKWIPRYFKEWHSTGDAVCFKSGATSKTSLSNSVSIWKQWSLEKPE